MVAKIKGDTFVAEDSLFRLGKFSINSKSIPTIFLMHPSAINYPGNRKKCEKLWNNFINVRLPIFVKK